MWNKVRNGNVYVSEWFLVAYDDDIYSPTLPYEDNRDIGGIEELPITEELVDAVADYYRENPGLGIRVQCRQPHFEEADSELPEPEFDDNIALPELYGAESEDEANVFVEATSFVD